MENTEKNRLIGNFMEWKNIPPITTEEGSLTFCNGFEFLDKTKFHCSWDWLMPVVEKIEEFNLTVDIQNIPGLGQYCRIYSAPFNSSLGTTK